MYDALSLSCGGCREGGCCCCYVVYFARRTIFHIIAECGSDGIDIEEEVLLRRVSDSMLVFG